MLLRSAPLFYLPSLSQGYGRCGRMSKVTALWRRLECRSDVRWTPYIFGCAVEAFTACGNLTQALSVAEMAKTMNIILPDQQLSALIRLCVPHQRFGEAIKLYRYMREHNMNPCDVTYNNLMHTCVQAGDLETAIEILHVSILRHPQCSMLGLHRDMCTSHQRCRGCRFPSSPFPLPSDMLCFVGYDRERHASS